MYALQPLDDLRLVKTPRELGYIKQAAAINDRVLSYVLKNLRTSLRRGTLPRECDMVTLIKQLLEREGAEALAFPPLVASGAHAAAIHHAIDWRCDKKLARGNMVVIDFGAAVNGYNSDMTRTVFLGKPDAKQTNIYNFVLAAQEAQLKKVREGISGGAVDKVGRHIIVKGGYRAAFRHGSGHGVGLQIHERPNLKQGSREKLLAGEVITIEPGIYLKAWGGVRIEDLILVTKNGHESLSHAPKTLEEMVL